METRFLNTFNYYDFNALNQLGHADPEQQDEALKTAAQHLESVFLNLVLKCMDEANASFKSDVYNRDREDFFHGMLNQQLSLSLSKAGGIGLADAIVKQLNKNPHLRQSNQDGNLLLNGKEMPI